MQSAAWHKTTARGPRLAEPCKLGPVIAHEQKGLYAKDALTDVDLLQLREDTGADQGHDPGRVSFGVLTLGVLVLFLKQWLADRYTG